MYHTDYPEQFIPTEQDHLDAMQLIWESETYENLRKAEIQQILHPHGLVLSCGAPGNCRAVELPTNEAA